MKELSDIQVSFESFRLKKRETGEERTFTLRPFREGDEDGIMACVRSEYGESYFKRFFYDHALIREKAFSDGYDFFVAETDGVIAGFEIFTYPVETDQCIEAASQILNRSYRGYGLSGVMVDYIFRLLEQLEPSAIFVFAVTFHTSTQHTYLKRGMTGTGFRLGRFLTEMMENSYKRGRCDKYSEGIMIRPIAKRDAGTVYLPEEVAAFGERVYRNLDVRYEIRAGESRQGANCRGDRTEHGNVSVSGEAAAQSGVRPESGEYHITVDELQQFVEVRVITEGRDLTARMKELIDRYRGEGTYTIQVILYDDTPVVWDCYEELKKLGFFFTGIRPLCGPREQLCMQWVDDWELCMEDYVLTDSFRAIANEIEAFYEGRTQA